MFAYIRARFRYALIGGKLTAQLTGSHRGIGGGIQNPERWLQALLLFPAPPTERRGELACRLTKNTSFVRNVQNGRRTHNI